MGTCSKFWARCPLPLPTGPKYVRLWVVTPSPNQPVSIGNLATGCDGSRPPSPPFKMLEQFRGKVHLGSRSCQVGDHQDAGLLWLVGHWDAGRWSGWVHEDGPHQPGCPLASSGLLDLGKVWLVLWFSIACPSAGSGIQGPGDSQALGGSLKPSCR